MSMPLKEWLKTPEIKRFNNMSINKAAHEYFFRNPSRPMWSDHNLISSPADGIITTQGVFGPDETIEVKGVDISVNDLLGPHSINDPSLVVSIFMSAADVHWNRAPSDVTLVRYPMPPIRTQNLPMLWTERGLLDHGLIKAGTFGYMQANARVVNKCYLGAHDYRYYVIQIADSEVNSIVPMRTSRVWAYNHNERFGQIIWGSMCVLILPLDGKLYFRTTCNVTDHVEAGIDVLAEIA
jgi:phosphatidylserine decarboxylase